MHLTIIRHQEANHLISSRAARRARLRAAWGSSKCAEVVNHIASHHGRVSAFVIGEDAEYAAEMTIAPDAPPMPASLSSPISRG